MNRTGLLIRVKPEGFPTRFKKYPSYLKKKINERKPPRRRSTNTAINESVENHININNPEHQESLSHQLPADAQKTPEKRPQTSPENGRTEIDPEYTPRTLRRKFLTVNK